jgi:hypothetical protein
VPTITIAVEDRWWARRKRAFAPPYKTTAALMFRYALK